MAAPKLKTQKSKSLRRKQLCPYPVDNVDGAILLDPVSDRIGRRLLKTIKGRKIKPFFPFPPMMQKFQKDFTGERISICSLQLTPSIFIY